MFRITRLSTIALSIAGLLALALPAVAQFPGGPVGPRRERPSRQQQGHTDNRPSRIGDLSINDVSGGGASTYNTAQEQAFDFVKALFQFVSNAKAGNVTAPPAPTEKAIWYLGGVYLYCVIEEGTCPFLLDMVLEVDVARSRMNKAPSCPTMVNFWKQYLENGLEDRHKYATKTGYLTSTVEFNQRVRPKYVKCDQTVRGEISGTNSDTEYFRLRYRQGAGTVESLARSLEYLEAVRKQIPNVFVETGAINAAGERRRAQ